MQFFSHSRFLRVWIHSSTANVFILMNFKILPFRTFICTIGLLHFRILCTHFHVKTSELFLRVMEIFYNNILTEFWFFQNSRLHFIGTWRNRYRKRFPSMSSGFKCLNSNLNPSAISQKTVIVHLDMVNYESLGSCICIFFIVHRFLSLKIVVNHPS